MSEIQITEAKRTHEVRACFECKNCCGENKMLFAACLTDLPTGYYPVTFTHCD